MVVHANSAKTVQAGFLTFGSIYRLLLPVQFEQWIYAAFVLDYSGGPVPESNGVPSYAPKRAPELFCGC